MSNPHSVVRCELRILRVMLLNWRWCLLSKLILLTGVSYLFIPFDVIPDLLPVAGHLDELSFLMFGFVSSRRMIPTRIIEQADGFDSRSGPDDWQNIGFAIRVLRADLANFFMLQYRNVNGFLITGKSSGTHWLKFILSCALAEQFGVSPPGRSSGPWSDDIIGHPKWPRNHRHLPWIANSHTIPFIVFARRVLPYLPVVVLVRGIPDAMRSNYVKFRRRYGVSPAAYVRGDSRGRRFIADVWWYIHFYNRWGDVARNEPEHVLVVRYEDLRSAPRWWLRRIA